MYVPYVLRTQLQRIRAYRVHVNANIVPRARYIVAYLLRFLYA